MSAYGLITSTKKRGKSIDKQKNIERQKKRLDLTVENLFLHNCVIVKNEINIAFSTFCVKYIHWNQGRFPNKFSLNDLFFGSKPVKVSFHSCEIAAFNLVFGTPAMNSYFSPFHELQVWTLPKIIQYLTAVIPK